MYLTEFVVIFTLLYIAVRRNCLAGTSSIIVVNNSIIITSRPNITARVYMENNNISHIYLYILSGAHELAILCGQVMGF